ncbi:MAG: MFS transporter, partial [Aureliella sp.]
MLTLLAQTGSADPQSLAFFSFVTTHWQFCLLHFLEFAIWGAWIVVLGNMLNARGFSRKVIGSIYACMPIGSMISTLILGPLADKYFSTELMIGVLHLIGAVLLLLMAQAGSARQFYWLTFIYALAFSPTLSLVNAIVFKHDADLFGGLANQGFPWIRVFGTIGWIVAGLSLTLILKKGQPVNSN